MGIEAGRPGISAFATFGQGKPGRQGSRPTFMVAFALPSDGAASISGPPGCASWRGVAGSMGLRLQPCAWRALGQRHCRLTPPLRRLKSFAPIGLNQKKGPHVASPLSARLMRQHQNHDVICSIRQAALRLSPILKCRAKAFRPSRSQPTMWWCSPSRRTQ